jgi:hypothetical protein
MVENPNAIAFKYANGAICSILLAKAASKHTFNLRQNKNLMSVF